MRDADNQQERLETGIGHYLAGFADGEGCFHIAIQRRKDLPLGWQLIPEFHVSQHSEKPFLLQKFEQHLGCGYIKANHPKSTRDKTNVYVVRNKRDLIEKVIPFFNSYPILSEKKRDFEKFKRILEEMERKEHLKKEGFERLVKLAFSMYGNGRYRRYHPDEILKTLESSETVRQNRM